ncbi:MAG: hypothetical protein ABIW76_19135 [Fibrobacteria bacterium]
MTRFRKFLLLYGLALIFGFAMTGQYLKHVVKPGFGDDIVHRMMARANHIYLLFIGLLITASALVDDPSRPRLIVLAMRLGRAVLILSSVLLIAAFFREHSGALHDRVLNRYGCISALTGGVLLATKAFAAWKPADRWS